MARIAVRRLLLQQESVGSLSGCRNVFSGLIKKEIHPSTATQNSVIERKRDGRRGTHTEAVAANEYGRHVPKVDERIITVVMVDPDDGLRKPLKAMWGEGLTLLHALKQAGVDTGCPCPVIDRGTEVCMGNCDVKVASEWLAKLPPQTQKEIDIIKQHRQVGTLGPPPHDKHDRLSCVLELNPELDGLVFSLTPKQPGEIP